VGWTPTGDTLLSWVHTGLSLVDSQYYYFGVRARNRAGLIGPETWSDGILYVQGTSTPLPSPTLSSERVPTLRVYPSPAQRMVMVECLREMLPLKGYLINSEGRILRSVDLDASETSIPTESLSPGIYWLWFPPYAPLSFFRE
ncbi:MAG: hypothetical protein N2170_08255, partial [Bacteroidia bacterium]|nr:hypothetical protein [Bacteroidia bacterium]